MGDSLPPPAEFDLVGSYARRRGPDVEIVLADPKTAVSGSIAVRLARGTHTVKATGSLTDDSHRRRLVVRAPRSAFADGNWSMTLLGDSPEPLAARLLVQGERPLVLLWGAKDRPTVQPSDRAVPSAKRRVAAAGGRALDRVLSVLPDDRARQVRKAARSAARKVLG